MARLYPRATKSESVEKNSGIHIFFKCSTSDSDASKNSEQLSEPFVSFTPSIPMIFTIILLQSPTSRSEPLLKSFLPYTTLDCESGDLGSRLDGEENEGRSSGLIDAGKIDKRAVFIKVWSEDHLNHGIC